MSGTIKDESLPRNFELEREVLGEIIISGESALTTVETLLSTTTFYSDANATIYETILKLRARKMPIDIYNIAILLKSEGKLDSVGGAVYLSELTSRVASTVYIAEHAQTLRYYEVRRNMYVLAGNVMGMANDPMSDPNEIIEFMEKNLTELQVHNRAKALTMNESITQFYEWLMLNETNKGAAIATGLNGLDKHLNGGFRAPDLVVIGARPSVGKTQLATFFAQNAAMQGKHIYFVSIEMTAKQLIARMVAREGVSYSRMRQGRLEETDWNSVDASMAELQNLHINIADSPDCRQLSYIKSEARQLKRKGELDMMVIDYLGLIRTNQRFEKRYIEVGYITGELKALAKELDIPIILLAQLSRPAQGREKEPPKMENLRESGDIEQDADIIIFPHRPYVYDQTACDSTGRSWKDRGVLFIEKNREGERNVKTYFMNDPQFKDFWDDDLANEQPPAA